MQEEKPQLTIRQLEALHEAEEDILPEQFDAVATALRYYSGRMEAFAAQYREREKALAQEMAELEAKEQKLAQFQQYYGLIREEDARHNATILAGAQPLSNAQYGRLMAPVLQAPSVSSMNSTDGIIGGNVTRVGFRTGDTGALFLRVSRDSGQSLPTDETSDYLLISEQMIPPEYLAL
jgi:hypothetical protein